MIKLLLCLLSGAAIGVVVVQLRQQRLELGYQNTELHEKIRSRQAKLWNQQLQIAVLTAPNAINRTVSGHQLKLTSEAPLPPGHPNWIDARNNPDAEE